METIIWDEKLLSVGVMQFDNEHKFLIKYLNELNDAIKIGSSQTIMEEILVKIMHYTKSHFAHEEKYMTRYNYPGYEAHRQEHAMLTEQVSEFYKRFTEKKASFSLELIRFLYGWLTKHILGTDMKYKEFFSKLQESI
ncbi:MAG: hemerythrin family protein [Leptospiraceae bacterium]|nr:hemerythrin family protein [Leptospiraceae bacterium]MBL0265626.1 hemerythrin family protein [Leptospiraceae bacterium]